MIISHRKKFAFFANPKTGSKAAGIMLRMAGVFDENDLLVKQPFAATRTIQLRLPAHNLNEDTPEHLTPEGAIELGLITIEQLRQYDCFAFLREPEERFYASRIAMHMNRHGEISNGQPKEQPHRPQFEYFFVGDEQVVTPLNFDNYEVELKRLYVLLNAPFRHLDFPIIHAKRTFQLDKFKYLPHQHARDVQLYKTMLQNEIRHS